VPVSAAHDKRAARELSEIAMEHFSVEALADKRDLLSGSPEGPAAACSPKKAIGLRRFCLAFRGSSALKSTKLTETTMTEFTLATNNPGWGFWSTIGRQAEPGEAWPLAGRAIA
jgi:hypothetical protein